MNDSDATRPVAKTIIDTIVEAMQKGVEPFDEAFNLVPSEFDVELHPEAYQELETIFPLIEERAAVVLDHELDHMNRKGGSLVDRMTAWLSFSTPDDTESTAHGRYKPAGFGWQIRFTMSLDPQADIGDIAVIALLAPPRRDNLAGPKTRRLTIRGADGNFKTRMLQNDEPRSSGAPASSSPPPSRASQATVRLSTNKAGANASGAALARLSFKDEDGPRTFTMTQPEIIVGRGGEGIHVDLQVNTLADVSRQHLSLRYNAGEKTFQIRDISSYGTTIDGRPVRPGAETDQAPTPSSWEAIPPETTIGLAGVLFIDFKGLV